MNIPAIVILLGLMVFLAHALEDLFARTKVPDVLLLLALGLLLGPVSGLAKPEDLGAVGPVFTTLTLVVILFEGGLGLDLRLLVRSLGGATGLTLWSFVLTLAALMPLGRLLLGLTWLQAATFAACLAGTSSAVVIPVVQRLRITEGTRTVLALESALSDVLVIVSALGLMAAQAQGELRIGALLGSMVASFVLAALLGLGAGLAWSLLLNRMRSLRNSLFTTPAFLFVVYGLVELLGYSGAIAALVMGVTLGNLDALPLGWLRRSPETLSSLGAMDREVLSEVVFLMKTFLFVLVGLSIQLRSAPLVLAGLAVTAALLVLRIPAVHLSLPRTTPRFDAALCGAMNPKGLAAAVVASVPLQMGLPGGREIQLAVYAVVLFSILAASLMILLLERGWFGGPARLLYGRFPGTPADGGAAPDPAPEPAPEA
jgi:NhaP-type Na+/H+ or K+/H+ antiporter